MEEIQKVLGEHTWDIKGAGCFPDKNHWSLKDEGKDKEYPKEERNQEKPVQFVLAQKF